MNSKINKIVLLASVGLLAASFMISCSDKDDYTPASPIANQPAYFRPQAAQTYALGDKDTDIIFNLFRASVSDPTSVTLAWEGDTAPFNLPTSATFDAEDLETQATINLVPSDLDPTKVYTITVTISGTETTPYSQNYLTFNFSYVPMSDWEPFGYDEALGRDGMGSYTFVNYYSGVEDPVLVLSRYNQLNPNEMEFDFRWLIDNDSEPDPNNPDLWETFLTATSPDGGVTIRVPEQVFAYNANYGDVYVSDLWYYTGNDGYNDSYFDDVTGTFYLDIIAYVDAGNFGYGYETCTMNGYLDTNDYSLSLTDLGLITIAEENYELVDLTWPKVVSLVSYTVVDTESIQENGEVSEELLDALVEGITDGSVESTVATTQGYYTFSFPTKGNYTVVAVGFKQENDGTYTQKSYAYLSFDYVTPDPNEGWNQLGYVEYTDGYMGSLYGLDAYYGVQTYYVELQESEDYPGYYRLVNPYGADYPFNEPGDWNENVISYLYIDAEDPEFVYIPESPQTIDWGDGELTCYSQAAYYLDGGNSAEDVKAAGYGGTLENQKITFPASTLFCALGDAGWYRVNTALNEGDAIGPFCVDFATVTADPLAAASTASTRADVANRAKMAAQVSLLSARNNQNKVAKVVKYKSNKQEVGRHQTLNLTPRQFK